MSSEDIFVLDANFQEFDVLEGYESFIWTERYVGKGDFQMVSDPTPKIKNLMQFAHYLRHPDSEFIMRIQNVLDASKDGRRRFTASGTTLDGVVEGRVISPNWLATGNAAALMAQLVQIICVEGTGLSPYDKIPWMIVENLATSSPVIDKQNQGAQTLYKTLEEMALTAGLGFKTVLKRAMPYFNGDQVMSFQIYNGVSRPELLFSVDNDTLMNPSYLQSIENSRNIAYVFHEQGMKVVPRPGVASTISGLSRKVIPVDATDVKPADHVPAVYNSILNQRGLEILMSEAAPINLYDGEVPANIPYKYRKDYFLGDIVAYQGEKASQRRNARVIEHIWSCDSAEGVKAYPTFSVVD